MSPITNRFHMLERNCLRLASDLAKVPRPGLPEEMGREVEAHLQDLHTIMMILRHLWEQVSRQNVLVGIDPVSWNSQIAAITNVLKRCPPDAPNSAQIVQLAGEVSVLYPYIANEMTRYVPREAQQGPAHRARDWARHLVLRCRRRILESAIGIRQSLRQRND